MPNMNMFRDDRRIKKYRQLADVLLDDGLLRLFLISYFWRKPGV